MALRKFFHLIHIVDDLRVADELYDRVFSPERFVAHDWMDVEKRWASLILIGDFVIEPIQASTEPDHLQYPLSRFHTRFGQHFHSLAWYYDEDDRVGLYKRLRAGNVRVAKPGGGFHDDDETPGLVLFTHPKDTFGQLELVAFDEHWRTVDPRFSGTWSDECSRATTSWWSWPIPIPRTRV